MHNGRQLAGGLQDKHGDKYRISAAHEESENFQKVTQSQHAAVRRIEWEDHTNFCGCPT